MTPLTPAVVTALAQQAAESPAHLDPVLVHQVCQEWQIGQQAASLQRCIVEAAYQDKLKAEQQRDAALAERDKAHQSAIDWRATWEATQDTLTIANTTQRNLRDVLRETQAAAQQQVAAYAAERDEAQRRLSAFNAYLSDAPTAKTQCPLCRAEDTTSALTEARRVLKHVLSELKQTDDWGVVSELQAEIAAVLAQEEK
jgi:hypothetical protein